MRDDAYLPLKPDSDFFGRREETGYLCRRAADPLGVSPRIILTGGRWTGKTELLRRLHRELFRSQAAVVPVYYRFRCRGAAADFAEDFLKESLRQYLAFRRRDASLLAAEVPLDRLGGLFSDEGMAQIRALIGRHREAAKASDGPASLRNALTAPRLLAESCGLSACLILDDIDAALDMRLCPGGPGMMKDLADGLNYSPCQCVAAATSMRALEAGLLAPVEHMALGGLDGADSAAMLAHLSRAADIEFDPEVLAFASFKLCGNPLYMRNIAWAARGTGGLSGLKGFADAYAADLADGSTGLAMRAFLGDKGQDALRALYTCSTSGTAPEADLAEASGLTADAMLGALSAPFSSGIILADAGSIKWTGDGVARDYVSYAYWTRVALRSRDEARTALVKDCLRQGYSFRGSSVRGRLKEDVAGILMGFNGQRVPRVLLKNPLFSAPSAGSSPRPSPDSVTEELRLPQTAGCYESSRFERGEAGPAIVIAEGFENGRYDSGNEVVWIAGVKESASPVNLGDVESFLRRSAILRSNFGSSKVASWLVAGEGFTAEAQRRLEREGVYSSDTAQLSVLRDAVVHDLSPRPAGPAEGINPNNEFEIVLPPAPRAELVAARAAEEIGRAMGFDDETVPKIKAALVEACINAFEHSGTRNSSVRLKFLSASDRLVVYVQNRGADFDACPSARAQAPSGKALPARRGWGLELMKGFMDDVRVEKVEGGARIVLVKYLAGKGGNPDDEHSG